ERYELVQVRGEVHALLNDVIRPQQQRQWDREVRIAERVGVLAERLRERLATGAKATEDGIALYEELIVYLLFDRHQAELFPLVRERDLATRRVDCYRAFREDLERFAGP